MLDGGLRSMKSQCKGLMCEGVRVWEASRIHVGLTTKTNSCKGETFPRNTFLREKSRKHFVLKQSWTAHDMGVNLKARGPDPPGVEFTSAHAPSLKNMPK